MPPQQQCECVARSMNHDGQCKKMYTVGSIFLREFVRDGKKVWLCPDCELRTDVRVD